jgi:hypothetical protein
MSERAHLAVCLKDPLEGLRVWRWSPQPTISLVCSTGAIEV